jgi:hypothetical protein
LVLVLFDIMMKSKFDKIKRVDVKRAIERFKMLEKAGRNHPPVLVAQRVNLLKWRKTEWVYDFKKVRFLARYHDHIVTHNTAAEIFITKIPISAAHQAVVFEICVQARIYASSFQHGFLNVGNRTIHLPGGDREADLALAPTVVPGEEHPPMYRVIFEIEEHHRTIAESVESSAHYLSSPQVQGVLTVKIFPCRANNCFAAIAVLFTKNNAQPEVVLVDDAVSFGTASLNPATQIPPIVSARMRVLPPPVTNVNGKLSDFNNPWLEPTAALDPFITIPSANIFFSHVDPTTNLPLLVPGVPEAVQDLRIDLFRLLQAITMVVPF